MTMDDEIFELNKEVAVMDQLNKHRPTLFDSVHAHHSLQCGLASYTNRYQAKEPATNVTVATPAYNPIW